MNWRSWTLGGLLLTAIAPLFVTLGAATDLSSARTVIGGSMMGLSRRSLELV